MFLDVGAKIDFSLRKGIRDKRKNLANLGWSATHSCFPESLQSFVVRPLCRSVKRERQTVFRQVDRCSDEIIYRRKTSLTEYIVVDDAKVLEVSIAVA